MPRRLQRAILLVAVITGLAAVQGPSPDGVARVTQTEFKKLFDSKQVVIVDTRGDSAFKECHIRGAIELQPGSAAKPSASFEKAVSSLKAAKKTVVTYCACPREEEAVFVAELLNQRKVPDVRALVGGWNDWYNDGNAVSCRDR